jgi:hypothetical protein
MNPYQSPATVSDVISNQDTDNSPRVDGKCLMVVSGTVLPPFCIKTNQPVSKDDLIRKQFYWCSPWVGLLIVLSGLLLIAVYFIARRRCSLTFGLHRRVRDKYRRRKIFKIVATIALFFAIPFSTAVDATVAPIIALVLFLIAVVSLFIGNSALSVVKYQKGVFWIKGFSEEFLANIKQRT